MNKPEVITFCQREILTEEMNQACYSWATAEVGAFYWTVPAPDIVNPGREEQGSVSA
jgi:hypothetical protein